VARAREALLDHAATQVGGNQSSFCVSDGFAQRRIANAGLLREAAERLVFEYSHPT